MPIGYVGTLSACEIDSLGDVVSLKMVFERADLERVRLAADPDPMWEMVLAMQLVQARTFPAPYVGWRREVGHRLATAGNARAGMGLLRHLVGPAGDFPDFLTPPGCMASLDEGCESLARTPAGLLAADLSRLFPAGAAPGWARSLARGDRQRIGDLIHAVRDCYQLLVGPHWASVKDVTAADRRRRTDVLAGQGLAAVLTSIPGVLSWDGRVLECRYPESRTVWLGGRGLTLMPSYFCSSNPISWINADLPPLLVYRVNDRTLDPALVETTPRRLVSLLGATRAECLRLLLVPHTTSDLAERLGVSAGTASRQTTVLREAGLVASRRVGVAVLHSTTPLGCAVLAGDPVAAGVS